MPDPRLLPTASGGKSTSSAAGGTASATASPSQRVVVRVVPAAAAPSDPSGLTGQRAGAADSSGDPSGGMHGGRGYGGRDGGSVIAPPSFALPSFDAGQCSTVGFGIAISPSGSGAFGPAWESTNCRAYYNSLALFKMGHPDEAIALMRRVFPDVDAAFASTAVHAAPVNAPPAAPAIDCTALNAAQTGHGRMSPEELDAYRRCHA
jgi:hypothetical protein